MSAVRLDGKVVADLVYEQVSERVSGLARKGKKVGLATILVGDDPASRVYVSSKRKRAAMVGIESIHHELPEAVDQDRIEGLIGDLNANPDVDGILLQLPLPGDLDGQAAVRTIDPSKDVDGLHPMSLGALVLDQPGFRSCTPAGVLRMLDHYGIATEGAQAVVVGRSFLVGRPLSIMLSSKDRNATTTVAHSRTRDLPELCRTADILVAAIGRPRMVTADWVKPGATVIDVGINRTEQGLVGDVDYETVSEVAGAITPVPGGVGLMTVAMLMENTVLAAERSLGVRR